MGTPSWQECMRRKTPLWLSAAMLLSVLPIAAKAAPILIVATGADNTAGRGTGKKHPSGVDRAEAYPAQLEAMLRSRGVDARVVNAGVAHDNTLGILRRLSSDVPDGTALVILNVAKGNDKKQGVGGSQAGYIQEIKSQLSQRHIPLIILPPLGQIAEDYRAADGHHFGVAGHIHIATYLLPKVLSALRQQPRGAKKR